MDVMGNGQISTPLINMQPMGPYFVLLMLEDNQTKHIVISKILMEESLMSLLLPTFEEHTPTTQILSMVTCLVWT
jgi:hypothetical protein